MKKRTTVISTLMFFLLIILISSCATTSPVVGGLYTNVTSPSGDKVATEAVNFDKMGEATCKSVLGLVAWGECSIDGAMKNGQLTRVHHVDQLTMSIAFFYSEYTVKVYGE